MTARTLLGVCVLAGALLPGARADAKDEPPKWEAAKRLYESAADAYKAGQWKQAGELLETFVNKYGSHENVPVAYLQLAECSQRRKDAKGRAEAIDVVIRRFQGCPAWFVAWGARLSDLKAAGRNDEYLAALQDFARPARLLPFRLNRAELRPGWTWCRQRRPREDVPVEIRWMIPTRYRPDWEQDIVAMADTPGRAAKALRILSLTLRKRRDDLPTNWQFAHVLLLRQAGRKRDAQRQFDTYCQAWADDPRALGLWQAQAEHCQDAGNDEAADVLYARILKQYRRSTTLSIVLGPRFEHLYNKRRLEKYAELAKWYLAAHPNGKLRGMILDRWLRLLRPAAVKADADAPAAAKAVLETYYGEDGEFTTKWLIDLHIDRKLPDEAARLARFYLADGQWSARTYEYLRQTAAGRCRQFAALVTEAQTKYGIFDPGPDGEAAKLLDQLGGLAKEDDRRGMERVAEKVLADRPRTDTALRVVKFMIDYYRRAKRPRPRDRWVRRMTEAFARHPETEKVLVAQAQALRAEHRRGEAGHVLDTLRARFPAARLPFDWAARRLESYGVASSEPGAEALLARHCAALAGAGDANALRDVARLVADPDHEDVSTKDSGDFWMSCAARAKGTWVELYCLHEAADSYFFHPLRSARRGAMPDPNSAVAAAEAMRKQDFDPEVRWLAEFADIDILARAGRGRDALDRLDARLGKRKKVRDLSLRLDLDALARALGKDPRLARRGLALGRRLSRVCFTSRDAAAVEAMLGRICFDGKAYALAEARYMKAVKLSPRPVRAYPAFRAALASAKKLDPKRPTAVAGRYIARIANCQGVVPRILADVGLWLLEKKTRPGHEVMLRTLASKYPASESRGRLQEAASQNGK